jgi:hypothetical protein
MEKSVLIEQLSNYDGEEVYIEDSDGIERDFTVELKEETFDGFYSAYPAHINLKIE